MAIRRRFRYFSGVRIDVPHLRSLESAVTADFDDLIRGVITGLDKPYVIRGFELNFAADNGSPSNIQLKMADSSVLHVSATEPGTILTLGKDEPLLELNPSSDKIIGSWSSNAVNYVALDYRRVTGTNTTDQVAGWSQQDKVEVQKSVPIGTLLDYRIVITTSGFGNYLPLYKVYVTQPIGQGQQIDYIQRAIPNLFRLGSGGLVPNPYNSYQWTEEGGSRNEGQLTQTGAISPNSLFWKTGDMSIKNLKDAFDATWTRFKEITNSVYWYADSNLTDGQVNLTDLFFDTGAGSVFTSDGSFAFTLQAKIIAELAGDYDVGFSTKLADIFNSTNWSAYYDGLVRMFDNDPGSGDENGRGTMVNANGTIVLISGLQGLFTAGDDVVSKMRVPINALDVTSPGSGVAQITLDSWTLFDGVQSIFASDSMTFRGTISGASDPAYNATDVLITVTGTQTILTYTVSTSITLPATGSLFLDGVVFAGAMAPSLTGDPNPAAGPVSFDADILINSVIGRKTITIAKESLAVELDNGSTVQDPTYGPGTFQLKNDDEVAFIVVERDLDVGGAGAVYTSSNPGVQKITGPNPTFSGYYGTNQVARIGDYVRFDGGSETQWRKIVNITSSLGVYTLDLDAAFASPYTSSFTGRVKIFRGIYGRDESSNPEPVIQIAHRNNVPANPNVFWICYRKDRDEGATQRPTVYLRQLELQVGEERQVNDNQTSNALNYTGQLVESNRDPNYSTSTTQSGFEFQVALTVSSKDEETNTVYFTSGPDQGFIQGDIIHDNVSGNSYTVAFPLTDTSVVVLEDIQSLNVGSIQYRRPNYGIIDGDNLTIGERKTDRMLAYLFTTLLRPVYDESVYVQYLNVTGSGTIESGDWLVGSGPGLAWVLAGEGEAKDGDTGSVVSGRILVHVVSGTFANTDTLTQGLVSKTASSNLTDTKLYGNPANGQDLKLPPNQRVNIPDNLTSGPTGAKVYPHAAFSQKTGKGGGELLVIANDTPRECSIDYSEISGGPGATATDRAKIRLIRSLPIYSRLRFRNLATFGVAPQSGSGVITLQNAYNGSISGGGDATIDTILGKPTWIRPPTSSVLGLRVSGLVGVDGPGSGVQSLNDKESALGTDINRWSQLWTQTTNVKQHDNYTGSHWVQTTAGVTSVGVSLTLAFQRTLATNTALRIKVTAIGRNDTGIGGPDAQSGFSLEAVFRRESGTAALIGSPITSVIGMSPDSFQHMITAQTSGNDVQVFVAGGTGQTVHWALTIDFQEIVTGA